MTSGWLGAGQSKLRRRSDGSGVGFYRLSELSCHLTTTSLLRQIGQLGTVLGREQPTRTVVTQFLTCEAVVNFESVFLWSSNLDPEYRLHRNGPQQYRMSRSASSSERPSLELKSRICTYKYKGANGVDALRASIGWYKYGHPSRKKLNRIGVPADKTERSKISVLDLFRTCKVETAAESVIVVNSSHGQRRDRAKIEKLAN